MERIEGTDLQQQQFEGNLSRYQLAAQFLNNLDLDTHEELDHASAIEAETWAGLMESVNAGWLDLKTAEQMYHEWFIDKRQE